MRRAIAITILVAACFARPAFSAEKKCSADPEAMPLCAVLTDAAKYDGKDLTVRGTYYRVIHGSILTAPACRSTKVNVRSAEDWKANEHALSVLNLRARKNQGTDVVLRGTFRVAHDGCFGQTCTLYEIDDHELLCAEAPQPEGASGTTRPKDPALPTLTTR